jgi:pimeloyl-ACP methyl ester carboxylesterase
LSWFYLHIPREKNFDELAEHFNELFSNDSVNLVGFSLGGYIATYFSLLYPQRVNKLFVISNSPTSLSSAELNQRKDTLQLVKKYGYKGISRHRARTLLDAGSQIDRLTDIILEMDNDLGEAEFISQYQYTSNRIDLAARVNELPRHTCFYYSVDDSLVSAQWLNKISKANPKLSVISTAGSGHMLPLEKPRELAEYLNDWAQL